MEERKSNVWLSILSVLIPVVGLVLFLVKKDSEKEAAKIYAICGIIGFIINFLFFV